MRQKLTILFLITLIAFSSNSFAQDYGAGIKIGTRGFRVEGLRSFGPDFNVRLGYALLPISTEGGESTDDYLYDAKATLSSLSIITDWFPFENTFRLSAGFLINLNKGEIDLNPTQSYQVGGDEYTPDKLGNLKAEIDFNRIAPYLGIGFGNPMAGDSGFKFSFAAGTFYHGAPRVKLSADGLISPSASPDQEETLESNLKWFKWYPVLNFGVTYKF